MPAAERFGLDFVDASADDPDAQCGFTDGGLYPPAERDAAPAYWGFTELRCDLGNMNAGKSTTVKILTTLSRPESGEARVAGLDVLREPEAVRQTIGVVAQRARRTDVHRRRVDVQRRQPGDDGAPRALVRDVAAEEVTLRGGRWPAGRGRPGSR